MAGPWQPGPIRSLGYLAIETARREDWHSFAGGLLGLQATCDSARDTILRADERAARLFLSDAAHERIAAIGWEVADEAALASVAMRLSDAGAVAIPANHELCERRRVKAALISQDPLGNRLEFFHGGETAAKPFTPGRAVSGFRTGELGLGHIVLTARNAASMIPFYTETLGFHLSDYALRPFGAYFFHLNSRHHSFAVVETGEDGVHHLMLELNSLDDVGQAYDLALLEEGRVGVTLGRHTNDFMTSFYARSPSNFMVEYGWGGRSIDPSNWTPFECTWGPSLWGHERSWLPEDKRAEARALRIGAAAAGIRAPDFVRPTD